MHLRDDIVFGRVLGDGHQPVLGGHHRGHWCIELGFEANIPISDYTDDLFAVDNGHT